MAMTPKIAYGSGKVFTKDFVKADFPAVADGKAITDEEMAALIAFVKGIVTNEDLRIGALKDGYQFNIETEKITDQDDLGEFKIDDITKETGTVQFKIFNFNAETISKQYPTAQYYKDSKTGFGVGTVGGLAHLDNTAKVIVFLHNDKMHGDTITIAVGKNTSGFEMIYKQDSVTPFSVNFECEPVDDAGHVMIILDAPKDYKWNDSTRSAAPAETSGLGT